MWAGFDTFADAEVYSVNSLVVLGGELSGK